MAIEGGTRIHAQTNIPVLPINKGTLGCWAIKLTSGGPVLLSNRHVMAKFGGSVWGEDYPNTAIKKKNFFIGTITNQSKVTDAALATPTGAVRSLYPTKQLKNIGAYNGFGDPADGMEVVFNGAEGGHKIGRLELKKEGNYTHASETLAGPGGKKILFNAFVIRFKDDYKLQKGDSGSPIVDTQTGNIVGLASGAGSLSGNKGILMSEIVKSLGIQPL